jgi:hypothetical protein
MAYVPVRQHPHGGRGRPPGTKFKIDLAGNLLSLRRWESFPGGFRFRQERIPADSEKISFY